jgi:hypothetical protein
MLSVALNQPCTITPQASISSWGDSTPGTPVVTSCRCEPTSRQVRLPDGQLITLRAIAYLPAGVLLAMTSIVTVGGIDYTPVQLDQYPGLDGAILYQRVFLT